MLFEESLDDRRALVRGGAAPASIARWSRSSTDYGPLPFKVSRLAGRVVTVTPEFADVVRIAREKSLPVREVLDQARAAARRHLTP